MSSLRAGWIYYMSRSYCITNTFIKYLQIHCQCIRMYRMMTTFIDFCRLLTVRYTQWNFFFFFKVLHFQPKNRNLYFFVFSTISFILMNHNNSINQYLIPQKNMLFSSIRIRNGERNCKWQNLQNKWFMNTKHTRFIWYFCCYPFLVF